MFEFKYDVQYKKSYQPGGQRKNYSKWEIVGKQLILQGPIDRKINWHGENDGFVLYVCTIKQCSSYCKYTLL